MAFYHAIGMAVTQWAHVENGLYNVACCVFDNKRALANGFAVIENFRSKLSFTEKVVMFAIKDKEMKDEWEDLANYIQSLAKFRNKIAHGYVVIFTGAPAGRRYALVPTFSTPSKKKSNENLPPSGSLCVKDIDLIAKQFGIASSRLLSFSARMQGHQDLFGDHIQQEQKVQSLDQLRRQIYSMLPTRPKSSRG